MSITFSLSSYFVCKVYFHILMLICRYGKVVVSKNNFDSKSSEVLISNKQIQEKPTSYEKRLLCIGTTFHSKNVNISYSIYS